jgi:branched-chain amino acid transport system ATP-binding protein
MSGRSSAPAAMVAPDPSGAQPVLELDQITAGYGGSVVLRQVSLSVPRSRVVALLGPNGAGKTTLLRTAAGLLRPMAGRVRLAGTDMTGRSPHEMARAGLCHLPEGRGIFPSLTVGENLLLATPKRAGVDAVGTAGEKFPVLGTRLKQLAGSLSGGEQQMLALARAFLTEPAVVVVDEPSLGLSPIVVEQIFSSLEAIVRGGTAVLLVEQYVNRALELADFVYLLNRGSVVFSGTGSALSDTDIFERYLGIDVGTGAGE